MTMKNRRTELHLSGVLPAIHSMGVSVWDPINAQRQHVGACWEVVHIVRGLVRLHLANDVFQGKAGDSLLVPAQTPHRDEFPLDTEFEVLHVMFKWPDAPALFPRMINRDLVLLPPVDKQTARELAYDTYECFKRQRPMWREMTQACLYRLLIFLWSAARELRFPRPAGDVAAARERRRVMIADAKGYILAHLGKPVTLTEIAAHLGISACHLSHLFSEESGFTLSSYLVNARMKKVAYLLANPKVRVSEAAYAVGFEDPNYFSKAFRRHFRCSPEAYQARLLRARRAG